MLGSLLALACVAAPARPIAVYPVHRPAGASEAQAVALRRVVEADLAARGAQVREATADAFASCERPACLLPRKAAHPGEGAVVLAWTGFGEASVLSALVLDDRAAPSAWSTAVPVAALADLPRAASALAAHVGDGLGLPPPGERRAREEGENTIGLALKVGNTLGSFASDAPALSGFNFRFDLEVDYLAAASFWPFVDLSLVLAHDAHGQGVQLVPVLLGAKYVFRPGAILRPFAGMALGLNFLSESLDAGTGSGDSFAVYGMGGLDGFITPNVAVLGEVTANLNGLEASGGSGVLFAVGFNLGAVVLF